MIHKVPFIQNIDFYYLGLWKKRAIFDDAIGEENRQSIGTRIWKTKEIGNMILKDYINSET